MGVDLDGIRVLESERIQIVDKLSPLVGEKPEYVRDVPSGEENIEATEKAIKAHTNRLGEINEEIWRLRGLA
jgi:hypothetical protein